MTAAILVALTLFLAPALGVPHEEMLQDTLKSMVVAFGTLAAVLALLLRQRDGRPTFHPVVLLPLALAAYAIASMAWSHMYLAGGEAIRWTLFSLLVLVVLNVAADGRRHVLAWGVHLGAVVAATWAVLQFTLDFRLFPQGPAPASTFVNRNFYAEFAVCTLPFGAWLLASSHSSARAVLLAATNGLVVVSLLMTGTRAALVAMGVQVLVLMPWAAWRWRERWMMPKQLRVVAAAVAIGVVAAIGFLPTSNPQIVAEGRGTDAIARAIHRTASIGPQDSSLQLRSVMWQATGRMIAQHPLAGVGAGAWEVDVPLYQSDGAQLEDDYHAHNEFLQLVAEYGVVGWVFLLGLVAWLFDMGRRALQPSSDDEQVEAPWRAVLLSSLLALLAVSNVGFPWRMATTGALFALCVGALAASDLRAGARWPARSGSLPWNPGALRVALAATVAGIGLAGYICVQAARAEAAILRAALLALSISRSGEPNAPRWQPAKAQVFTLAREGIAINPHFRKVTPIIADEAARWGDWANALWIWDSVLGSRPHVVAIMANLARACIITGDLARAQAYIDRGLAVQPASRSLLAAQVLVFARTGQDDRALSLGREALSKGVEDFAMTSTLFILARDKGDFALAERAMRTRLGRWDTEAARGWLDLGLLHVRQGGRDSDAAAAFNRAWDAASPDERVRWLTEIPARLRPRAAQMSASKG